MEWKVSINSSCVSITNQHVKPHVRFSLTAENRFAVPLRHTSFKQRSQA